LAFQQQPSAITPSPFFAGLVEEVSKMPQWHCRLATIPSMDVRWSCSDSTRDQVNLKFANFLAEIEAETDDELSWWSAAVQRDACEVLPDAKIGHTAQSTRWLLDSYST
jgi:hypothetical protein